MKEILMMKGAMKLVETCGNVQENENVLIVTDFNLISVAEALAKVAYERNAKVVIMAMEPRKMHNEAIPSVVGAAMAKADVVFVPTTFTVAHTKARIAASKAGARIINMPDYSEEVLVSPALTEVDFEGLAPKVKKVAEFLTKAKKAHVTSVLGTDVILGLDGREGAALTGLIHEKGQFGTPPDIEGRITPVEGTTNGIIYVDGSIPAPGVSLLSEPIKVVVKDGFVTDISGGQQARNFAKILKDANDHNVYNIAELGIGMNPLARLKGVMTEDEGMTGTIHIAVGTSGAFGGKIHTSLHLDMIQRNPTVVLDDSTVLLDTGKLMI